MVEYHELHMKRESLSNNQHIGELTNKNGDTAMSGGVEDIFVPKKLGDYCSWGLC
jgi:hypothetical protein